MKNLLGDAVVARDGAIGLIVDVYFDDDRWSVRYLVLDTGRPMPQRQVLVPSASILRDAQEDDALHVALTRRQVEKCPDADTDLPVWRQHELSYAARAASNPHLRSTEVVGDFNVHAQDGMIGHVEDFLVDERDWTIGGIVVATSNWLPGRRVLVEPHAVERIDWPYRQVYVALTRAAIRALPACGPAS